MKPVRLLPPLAILLAMTACNGGARSDNGLANADLTANDLAANDAMAAETIDEGDASAEVAPLPTPPNGSSAPDCRTRRPAQLRPTLSRRSTAP